MKIKFKLNIKALLSYIFLTIVSAAIFSVILVALPLTERISEEVSFNLTTRDSSLWSKEYTISLKTSDRKKAEETREILYRRLRNYAVERESIYIIPTEEGEDAKLRLIVTTSKDKDLVEELIKNRFQYEVMTRKEDVNFEDEENPYAYIDATNYNPTDWNYEDFRNIYITKLKTNSGTYSYFALYKLWPSKEKEFVKFLSEYSGQLIGVSVDGFVSPYQVPTDIAQGGFLFALPVYTEEKEKAEVISLLYNSGHIPIEFSIEEQKDLPILIPTIDYLRVAIGLTIALVTSYLYIFMFKQSTKKRLFESFFTTVFTIALYITILKIQHIPVYTLLLTLECILIAIIIRVFEENKESRKHLFLILLLSFFAILFWGNGLIMVFAREMIFLLILGTVSLLFSKWYLNKVKKI